MANQFVLKDEERELFTINNILQILQDSNNLRYFYEEWQKLAERMDVADHEIKHLKVCYNAGLIGSLWTTIHGVLKKWMLLASDSATLEALVNILYQLGMKSCWESILKGFNLSAAEGNYGELVIIPKAICVAKQTETLDSLCFIPFRRFLNTNFTWNELKAGIREYIIFQALHQVPSLNLEAHQQIISELDCATLKQLIKGERVEFFKETFPTSISYYVSRRIAPRNIISNEIFSSTSGDDIFLFSKVEMPELYAMAGRETTGYSRDHLDYPKERFLVLNELPHFEIICKRTKRNVHLLEMEGGYLKWRKSKGKVEVFQKCQAKVQDEIKEELFISSLRDSPVIISDTPGMGKSTFLAKIGNHLRQSKPDIIVLFVEFGDFVRKIKNFAKDNSLKEKIEMVLKNNLCLNSLGRHVFRTRMNQEQKQFELLLDGFDEINSSDSNLALEIVYTISTFKSIRIWVTSRPHFLDKLKEKLNVLGFNILHFDKEEQIEFLTKYWSRPESKLNNIITNSEGVDNKNSGENNSIDKTKLRRFSEICLETLKKRLSDRDKEITGIPLQCLMVGVVFEDFVILEDVEGALKSSIRSITDLYKRFIDNRFDKFKERFGLSKEKRKLLTEAHVKLSLKLLFKDCEQFNWMFNEELPSRENVLNVGIVESWMDEECPKFIHRTFAEYLIAWSVVEKLIHDDMSDDLIYLFFRKVLYVGSSDSVHSVHQFFDHPVVCHFLNCLLVNLEPKDGLLDGVKSNVIFSARHPFIIKICHATVYNNYFGIYLFLDKLKVFDPSEGEIFTESFLKALIENGGVEILESALNHFENSNDLSEEIKAKIFEAALDVGKCSLVQFLLNKRGLDELVKTTTRPLFHYVIEGTLGKPHANLPQRKDIIDILYSYNKSLLEQEDKWGQTPLLADGVHVELLEFLLRMGANFFAQAKFGNTFLHNAAVRGQLNSEQLHRLLETINKISKPERSLRQFLQIEGTYKIKPFTAFLLRDGRDPLPETIELAVDMGVDLNELNSEGFSNLAVAINNNMGIETIQTLLKLKADAKWKHSETLETLVHRVAAKDNPDVLALLLDDHKLGVNDKDSIRNTPLDVAAIQMHTCLNLTFSSISNRVIRKPVESGMVLIRRGGSGRRDSLTSVLHHAILLDKEEWVKELIFEKRLNVNKIGATVAKIRRFFNRLEKADQTWSTEGEYPFRIFLNFLKANVNMEAEGIHEDNLLHILMSKFNLLGPQQLHSFVEIVIKNDLCHLLKKQNIYGETPVHNAIGSTSVETQTLNLFNEMGFDLKMVCKDKRNLLFKVVYSGRSVDMLESLINFGVNLKQLDCKGESLLHACCKARNVEALKFLLPMDKLDINQKNGKGRTPLHKAVLTYDRISDEIDDEASMDNIILLLQSGAEYKILDRGRHDLQTLLSLGNVRMMRMELQCILPEAVMRLRMSLRNELYA